MTKKIVDNTLRSAIIKNIKSYPTLYSCRTDVLDHFFCVIGNGYEWNNGILENIYLEKSRPLKEILRDEKQYMKEYTYKTKHKRKTKAQIQFEDEQDARMLMNVRQDNILLKFRYDNAESLSLITWDQGQFKRTHNSNPLLKTFANHHYTISKYSLMCNVPKNVKKDWLAGVREMIYVVFESIPEENTTRARFEQEENVQMASFVLTDLAKRFGSKKNSPTSYNEFLENKKKYQEDMLKFIKELNESIS